MAIDSARKRFSLMGFGSPIPAAVFPPTGTIDAAARLDLLFLYALVFEALIPDSALPALIVDLASPMVAYDNDGSLSLIVDN